MSVWHTPAEEKCLVCLAGAVMARTCQLPGDWDADPDDLPEYATKLKVLDYARRGLFRLAVPHLGTEPDPSQSAVLRKLDETVPAYLYDPGAFLERLRACADQLQEVGL